MWFCFICKVYGADVGPECPPELRIALSRREMLPLVSSHRTRIFEAIWPVSRKKRAKHRIAIWPLSKNFARQKS